MATISASTGSSGQQSKQFEQLQGDVDEVAGLLRDNIDKVLERGEKLDTMVDRTEDLQAGAEQFQKTSKKVKRAYCFKNVKMTCLLIVVIIVIIAVIALIIVLVTKPWESGGSSGGNNTLTSDDTVSTNYAHGN
ncbi:vesicle-associated membrane protein 3-like [Glandiceps talaboti]